MSYPEHSLGKFHSFAEMQLVYSTAPADWALNVVANVLDCNIVVRKFKHQLHDYVPFKTNTLGKVMNPFISPAMNWIEPLLYFYKYSFDIK